MTCSICGLDCYEDDDGTLMCEGCDQSDDACTCADDDWYPGKDGEDREE